MWRHQLFLTSKSRKLKTRLIIYWLIFRVIWMEKQRKNKVFALNVNNAVVGKAFRWLSVAWTRGCVISFSPPPCFPPFILYSHSPPLTFSRRPLQQQRESLHLRPCAKEGPCALLRCSWVHSKSLRGPPEGNRSRPQTSPRGESTGLNKPSRTTPVLLRRTELYHHTNTATSSSAGINFSPMRINICISGLCRRFL